MKKQVFLPLL